MKRSNLVTFFVGLAVCLYLSGIAAFAQHGGGHAGGAGGGAGGGQGGSSAGRGSTETGGRSSGANQGKGSSVDTGKKTPDELLAQNTKLASNLQSLLPPGTDLQAAAKGFKNLGEFVAAVHVSKNLDIPFSDLKAKLTGPSAVSLGKAIHELKPEANAKDEARKAHQQAKKDQA